MKYNKIVRDRIPEMILEEGKSCKYRIITGDGDFNEMMEDKLFEEAGEYCKEPSIEELADVLAVVYGIAQARGWSLNDLEAKRVEKENKNGAFDKRFYLEEVD